MAIYRLVFDPTSASTIAESSSVGAFIRAGTDGELIDSTSNALHVNIQNASIAVTASDLDIRDLSYTTDSVTINDNGGSITVDASDLDIRDLTHVSDSVKIGDGTDFLAIANDGSIAVTDNGSSLTVDAVNLDIRDLVAANDSVAAWLKDGAGTSITSTTISSIQALDVNIANTISVNDAALANTSLVASKKTASDTGANLIASPLTDRKYLFIYNNDNRVFYIGGTGVTSAVGFPVYPGSLLEARIGAAVDVEVITATGVSVADIRVLEAS